MAIPVDAGRITELVQRMDARATLVRTWPLHGGVSAQAIAFEAELPGGRRKFVLRRHGEVDRLQNP
ncbi:MAG: hypothetical protein ACK2UO_20300, partial [Caldilineaceae bacterium]